MKLEPTITAENAATELPVFKSVYIAVFNSREHHRVKGRKAVLAKYGKKGWSSILRATKSGVMGIFGIACTPELLLFAETVARASDASAARRKKRSEDIQCLNATSAATSSQNY